MNKSPGDDEDTSIMVLRYGVVWRFGTGACKCVSQNWWYCFVRC